MGEASLTDTSAQFALIGALPMGLATQKLLVERGIAFQGFELRFQRVAATQASNFSAGVWYRKVFLGRSFSWRTTSLSLA